MIAGSPHALGEDGGAAHVNLGGGEVAEHLVGPREALLDRDAHAEARSPPRGRLPRKADSRPGSRRCGSGSSRGGRAPRPFVARERDRDRTLRAAGPPRSVARVRPAVGGGEQPPTRPGSPGGVSSTARVRSSAARSGAPRAGDDLGGLVEPRPRRSRRARPPRARDGAPIPPGRGRRRRADGEAPARSRAASA